MSFGGHQTQTIERIKALYDMYIGNLLRKRGLKLYKKYFEFLSIPSWLFIIRVLHISCQQNSKNFFNMIIYTDRFSKVLPMSNA